MSNDPDPNPSPPDSHGSEDTDALREQREEQEAFAKLSLPSAWTTDPDGSLREDSPNWRDLTGQTFEESLGHGWQNAIHPQDREAIADIWEERLETKQPLVLEYRVSQPDGGWRWLRSQGIPLFDSRGNIRKWVGITSDISRRKSAEIAQQESEERFRNMADNISQLAWMADREGYIFWYNQRWYDYTGTDFESMKGWGWKAVHHEDHIDRVVERFKSCIHGGHHWEDTFPLRGHDGVYRWYLSRALPIRNDEGEIVRWFGTNTDIDELRNAQDALRETDQRKDEFIATLAHELRNPLAPIRTGLEIMKSSLDQPETLEKLQVTMERQTLQLVTLIDDLLDASRVTRGKLQLRKSRIELQAVIDSALEATETQIKDSGHELHLDLPQQPVYLHADPHRLAQVFSNLLNNAAKYTPDGGEIWLSAHVEGQTLVLSVTDNGSGIPMEELDAVFDMFRQLGHPTNLSSGGLGIGLTLVKSLVEQHEGIISAHSDGANQGSTFTVKLPITEQATTEQPKATPTPSTAAQRSCRVLVVDDNRDAAETLSIMATLMNHEVKTAFSGPEALEIGPDFQPEIVLMDIGMPEMDGYETASRIRQEESWGQVGQVTLVAVTGWGQSQAQQRALEAGFDHHVVKGAEPAVFRELFAKVIEAKDKI